MDAAAVSGRLLSFAAGLFSETHFEDPMSMPKQSNSLRALWMPLLLLLCAWCQGQTPPMELTGAWQGTLGAGSVQLRLVLTFTPSGSGQYNAVLDSVDQGATILADKVTVNEGKLRMDFARVKGFYEGVINKEGTEMAGTWTQNGASQPLSFKRAAPESSQKSDAKPATAEKPFTSPVDVMVPLPPTAVQGNGKTHLVYELHLTNFSGQSTSLAQIEALDGKGTTLLRLGPNELISSVLLVGNRQAAGMDKLNIGPGQRAVVYMWITMETSATVPATLEHKVSVKAGKNNDEITVQCARVAVSRDLAVISAPLRGDNWVAANGPSNTSGHRRTVLPIDGKARIAQRFAIDWVRVNPDGNTHTGGPLDNKNYRAYGSEALAVADGTVVAVKDGIPQNIPGENSRAVPITLETVGGNHVVLDIGHGRYAFYAHLQPGSLKVQTGDRVKRGQVLGLVGNSGNSTEPHLHFHIGDSKSPLGSEGIPYALDSFDAKAKADAPVTKRRQEIPLEDEVVTFEK
jgi:murein DD-endopeptidase MepM/ murein hydrolase activator NlpD